MIDRREQAMTRAVNELDALVVSRFNGNPRTLSTFKVKDWIERWQDELGASDIQVAYLTVAKSVKPKMDVATVRARPR